MCAFPITLFSSILSSWKFIVKLKGLRQRLQRASEGLSKVCTSEFLWIYKSKKYINEYISFCKNNYFENKNNKKTTVIMDSATRSQTNGIYSLKGYEEETENLYRSYKFILIIKELIQKWKVAWYILLVLLIFEG